MADIEPTKVVKQTIVNRGPDNSENTDSAKTRSSYDSRIPYGDQSLVEAYRHYPLMRFFGLSDDEKADDKINNKVKSVYGWAHNKAKTDDPNLIMKVLRFLEMEIGLPPLGTSRLDHISGLVEIENSITDLEDERGFRYGV